MPKSALPSHLRDKKHTDWPTFFTIRWRGKEVPVGLKWIPRGWTAFKWGQPKLLLGNQKEARNGSPAPIGEAGSWQISYYPNAPWWAKPLAWYVAYSGKIGEDGKFRHFRVGSRWDDVDGYVTILSIASRKYTGDNKQDTST